MSVAAAAEATPPLVDDVALPGVTHSADATHLSTSSLVTVMSELVPANLCASSARS